MAGEVRAAPAERSVARRVVGPSYSDGVPHHDVNG